jgi:hypothetical protein
LWKANQLIRTLCRALHEGDLIVAAMAARSLVETAAAFGCESEQIMRLWRDRAQHPAPDPNSLQEFANSANAVIGQILFGTKLKRDKLPETSIERTNILTLIEKAERLSERPGVRRLYDLLCDTVHPSMGSNRCFWSTEPSPEGGPVFEFVTQRAAQGGLSELPFIIGKATLWALTWLGWMWNLLDRTRNDLCLTAKIHVLPSNHFAIVFPGKPDEYCPCGSTRKSQQCAHYFGRKDADASGLEIKPST